MAKTKGLVLAGIVRDAHRRIVEQRINSYFARSAWEQAYEPVRRDYWLTLIGD